MAIISGLNLTYEYKIHNEEGVVESTHKAIKDVALDVMKGEFIAILGHNGSGKSTLAKHINALLKPTEGTILIKGMDSKDDEHVWDIRQTAGMVFQNPDNQIIATIVEEDVAFGPENMGVEASLIREHVDKALVAVEMTEYARHSPNKLSGGQKQRIAIAGVLAMKPECIILDEPTAMLDPSGRNEVLKTVLELNKEEGITIILITHFMEEAVLADRVLVMSEGEVVLGGTPKEVFSKVEYMKSIGLSVPQVTEVASKLQKDGATFNQTILTIDEMVEAICQLK
jgi:energy-coupling factor transport system ATP-binding protein